MRSIQLQSIQSQVMRHVRALAPSMAYRGYRLAGLYRWMDRRCFYADEI